MYRSAGYIFLVLFLPFVALEIVSVVAETTSPCKLVDVKNPCQCVYDNGSIIDFGKDGFNNGTARFYRLPVNASDPDDTSKFSFNPCYPFTDDPEDMEYLNLEPRCQSTMSCLFKKLDDPVLDVKVKTGFGQLENADFFFDQDTKQIGIKYFTPALGGKQSKNLTVLLNCSEEATTPTVIVKGQSNSHLALEYTSQCACVDKCISNNGTTEIPTTSTAGGNNTTEIPTTSTAGGNNTTETPPADTSGLSTGSIIVIIFFTLLVVYILGGITWNVVLRGASGKEVLPQYEFWSNLPGLIGDGFCFVFSCCCTKTTNRASYDDM